MNGFPGSPRVLRGALISMAVAGPPAVVVFQYNPDSLSRTLVPRSPETGPDRSQVARLEAPPEETIRLDIDLDAADQLGRSDPVATAVGLHPALAALEIMLYPRAAAVIANEVLSNLGIIEIVPPEAPLTLLVWGPTRIVPVRITELTITEQAFDPQLNPIRARAGVSARVLTYDDLGLLSPGGAIFMAHQIVKERMAAIGTSAGLAAVPSITGLLPGGS
ncbi:MAG TPA: hypothetical protein VOB72_23015 [Candidatus Dormibacteraeota bacterium]|nr:hypothetical protein [Candidatus Dormibacteraeota bacterium]